LSCCAVGAAAARGTVLQRRQAEVVLLHGPVAKETAMSLVRCVEVIAQSPKGFDEACREAVATAAQTLRGIQSFWIKNAECVVEDGEIVQYRVNGKICFVLEEEKPKASKSAKRR
jgi:dodecin